MPRILVADDNSNIQKMVTLALKDIGIDVVAVPNGEAAVRKLTDANLDLVLADIFMPVRSGYEVCEYIKNDSRYSHLPVVLLVGAFDPLDEREAQRVGADGILKKPFVPPDPLINMVKSLLAKSASERLVPVAVPAAAEEASAQPAVVPQPKFTAPDFKAPVAEFSDAPTEEYITPEVSPLEFGDHESPIAFSNLLDPPTGDDRDLVLTAHRDPSLGEPAWTHPQAIAAETETEETSPEEALQDHTWGSHATPFALAEESTSLPLMGREAENLTGIADEDVEETSATETVTHEVAEISHFAPVLGIEPVVESGFESHAADAHVESVPESLVESSTEPVNGKTPEHVLEHVVEQQAQQIVEPEVERFVHSHDFQLDSAELAAASAFETAPSEYAPVETAEAPLAEVGQSSLAETQAAPDVSETQKIEPVVELQESHETAEVAHAAEATESSEEAPVAPVEQAEHVAEVVEAHTAQPIEHSHQDGEAAASAEHEATHTESAPSDVPAWLASAASSLPAIEPLVTEALEHTFASEIASVSEAHIGSETAQHAEHETQSEEAATIGIAPAAEAQAVEPAAVEHEPALSSEAVEVPSHPLEAQHGANGETNSGSHTDASPSVGSGTQSPEMIEAVVSRIVERMQPKVMDVVTREILRPLVEAMVRREMEKH